MKTPQAWGWFHLMWVGLIIVSIAFFYRSRKSGVRIDPDLVFGIYGFGSLLLELAKQLMWSVSIGENGAVIWDYSWYAAPFQLCTTPMFICIALCFAKSERLRGIMMDYLAYMSFVNMLLVVLLPGSCFCEYVIVNIHTMYLHCGGLIVSAFILINRLVRVDMKALFSGYRVFLDFCAAAIYVDISFVQLGIVPSGETFNMFYISPYFDCTLPVLSSIFKAVPYPVFLLTYLLGFLMLSIPVNRISRYIRIRAIAKGRHPRFAIQ